MDEESCSRCVPVVFLGYLAAGIVIYFILFLVAHFYWQCVSGIVARIIMDKVHFLWTSCAVNRQQFHSETTGVNEEGSDISISNQSSPTSETEPQQPDVLPPKNIQVQATCATTSKTPECLLESIVTIWTLTRTSENPVVWTISGNSTRVYDFMAYKSKLNTVETSYTIHGKVIQNTGKAYWKEMNNGTIVALWEGTLNFETAHFEGQYHYFPYRGCIPINELTVYMGNLKSTDHRLKPLLRIPQAQKEEKDNDDEVTSLDKSVSSEQDEIGLYGVFSWLNSVTLGHAPNMTPGK